MVAVVRAAPEYLLEGLPPAATVRAVVVAIHAGPVDVVVAWIYRAERSRSVAGDVGAPHPRDVSGALLHEDVVDVPPRAHIITRLVAIGLFGPGELPPAVHFPVEPQEQRVAPRGRAVRPLRDVRVMCPAGNRRQSIIGLVLT